MCSGATAPSVAPEHPTPFHIVEQFTQTLSRSLADEDTTGTGQK